MMGENCLRFRDKFICEVCKIAVVVAALLLLNNFWLPTFGLKSYDAADLPSDLIKNSSERTVSSGSGGALTYGPYLSLQPGKLKINLSYTAQTNDNCVYVWTNSGRTILKKVMLPADRHQEEFTVSLDSPVKGLEVVTMYAGKGTFSVARINIAEVKSGIDFVIATLNCALPLIAALWIFLTYRSRKGKEPASFVLGAPKEKVACRADLAIMAIFLICMLFTPVVWFFTKSDFSSQNSENRTLAKFPALSLISLHEFPSGFDSYYNDNAPFKSAMVSAKTNLDCTFLGELDSKKVLLGKNGWLFYKGENDNELKDYKHSDLFTQQELEKIAENLENSRRYANAHGTKFALMIMPNKSEIYSEYMPDDILRTGTESRADQLVEYLRSNTDIVVVYPKKDLVDGKADHPTYLMTDTHWNLYGAFLGTKLLLNSLNDGFPLTDVTARPVHGSAGDLADMERLPTSCGEKNSMEVKYTCPYSSKETTSPAEAAVNINHYYSDNTNHLKAFFAGDSFRDNMKNYLSLSFSETVIQHRDNLPSDPLKDGKYNIFVYELVERGLDDLLTLSPSQQ